MMVAEPTRQTKPSYAGKVAIRHAVEAAKAAGLDVGGLRVSPDGTIEILDSRGAKGPKTLEDEIEQLRAEGKL